MLIQILPIGCVITLQGSVPFKALWPIYSSKFGKMLNNWLKYKSLTRYTALWLFEGYNKDTTVWKNIFFLCFLRLSSNNFTNSYANKMFILESIRMSCWFIPCNCFEVNVRRTHCHFCIIAAMSSFLFIL